MKNYLKNLVLLALVFLSNVENLASQNQAKVNATKDSIKIVKPQFISTIDIIDRIELEKEAIKDTYANLIKNKDLKNLDSLLPIYYKFISDQKKITESFIKANPNRLKLTILTKKWNGYIDYLSVWQSVVNKEGKNNRKISKTVDFNRETWKLTYTNAREKKIPYEVIKNVKLVLDDIIKLEKTIDRKYYDLLKLESKVSKQITISKEVILKLNNAKNSNIYDLFYLRHEPLWKLSFTETKNQKIRKENSESIGKNFKDCINLLTNSEEQLNLFMFLAIFISLLVLYIKRVLENSTIYETGFEITRARDNLKDFTLSTILFSIVVIAKYTFINTPKLFDDFLSISILIIIIPLVKANLNPYYYKVLYFTVFVYLLNLVKTYLWLTTGQYKLYLLGITLLVFLSTSILSPDTIAAKKMKIGYFSRYLQKLTPILYVVSAIAMVSNILGYTNLTESILKACISGAVITMLFYYMLLIINSISVIIIHRHFNNQTGYDVKIKIKSQRKASKIIRSIMTIIAAIIFLRLIDLLDYVFNFVEGILSKTYNIGDLTFTIGAFVSFVLILIGSFIITRLVTFTFGESDKLFNIIKLPKGIPAAISLIVRYFIFAFGVTLALSSLGIDLSKFNLMAGALGLGIGFGLQTVVSNFISGLILVFERPILPGDTVEFGNLMGTVNKIGVRSSNISTFDGAEVVVPNNNLISNNLINWTLSDSIKRIEINIGATYDADPNKVIQLLGEAALSCEKVLKTPHPLPLLNDFGSSSLNFKLRFWVPVENGLSAKSDVSIAIYNKFKENNIEIPFPQQDISIKDISESLLHNRKDNLGKS